MTDFTYPLFPVAAGLGFILALIPLPWHLQAWNSGTCFYMFWASLACLNQLVNSIVWAGNALNPAPAWCEISIRITMGASVGIPAASLCINRRLYLISKVQAVAITHTEKKRAILIDTLICIVFPVVYIALQYVVQGHRFNIFEDIGCFPALYNTLPTYFISYMWPLAIGVVSAVYCVLSLREFAARRAQFSQFLTSKTSLTVSRYFRLMALAMTDIFLTTPLAAFIIWLNVTATPMGPWISWGDTHFNFSRVDQIPAVFWRMNHLVVVSMELTRWMAPVASFIFFAYFGFADEAKRQYRRVFVFARRICGAPPSNVTLSNKHTPIGHYSGPSSLANTALTSTTPTTSIYPLHDLKRSQSLTTIGSNTLHSPSSPHSLLGWPKTDCSISTYYDPELVYDKSRYGEPVHSSCTPPNRSPV